MEICEVLADNFQDLSDFLVQREIFSVFPLNTLKELLSCFCSCHLHDADFCGKPPAKSQRELENVSLTDNSEV